LQNELINGNSSVLVDIPHVISVYDTFPQETLQNDPQTSNGDESNHFYCDLYYNT